MLVENILRGAKTEKIMAVNGLLRVFSGNTASSSEVDSASAVTVADQAHRAEILDDFEKAGITWLWATDAEGRIIYMTERPPKIWEDPCLI